MPTEFSNCHECFHLERSDLNSYFNKPYKHDYDKMMALKECGFPTEIAIKIVQMTYSYYECDFCDTILCTVHRDRGVRNGQSWPYIKCDTCCWNDYT